jgi:hypothetical protein
MLGEAPPDVGRTASARGSSEPQNGDGGVVLRCPQPGKQKSGRRKKRDEQKRLVALFTAAAAETPSTPAGIVPATSAVVKDEDVHKDLVSARDDTPPELLADAQPEVEQAGSNEDTEEANGDDPDLSIRAGLIVNGVSVQREIVALNDVAPSQWTYTALSEIKNRVMTSVIGVVSSVGKEPTRTATGGTNYTSRAL